MKAWMSSNFGQIHVPPRTPELSAIERLKNGCIMLLAHLSRRLIGELLVYRGICRPSVRPSVVRRQHFQTTSSLKPLDRFFSYFIYSIYR